jgi:hypothetical protein
LWNDPLGAKEGRALQRVAALSWPSAQGLALARALSLASELVQVLVLGLV